MKKLLAIAVALAAALLLQTGAHAIDSSCLDLCDSLGGANFAKCMKYCRSGVDEFDGGYMFKSKKCPSDMEYIPAGSFIMGCTEKDDKCYGDETPAKVVEISKGFCMDRNEVTQDQYKHVTGKTPSFFYWCGGKCPVESVSWTAANSYCKAVGKRLPTEAQWEYAARGAETQKYYWGQLKTKKFAWYDENSFGRPHFVGKMLPNSYGLNDMAGNVLEWTADCYDPNWYTLMPDQKDPVNDRANCRFRSLRGGSWNYPIEGLRLTDRTGRDQALGFGDAGFRCVR